jgi:hypothetical protein
MKNKVIIASLLGLAVLASVGIASAQARGFMGIGSNATPTEVAQFQTDRFQEQANILGVSVDEVKNAWAMGQSVKDLAQSKGITQEQFQKKLQELRQTKMQAHLQTLVSQGVITQAQADQRFEFMKNNQGKAKMGKGMEEGFGGHRGMGF